MARPAPGWIRNAAALLTLVGLTCVAQPHLLASETLVSLDTASQFYPWYAFLGESLRAGHVPGWNPAVFAGAPFAANPLSGWSYLPAMLLFMLLPLAQAAPVYLAFHVLLAGSACLALARSLGINRMGALLAGVAYANTGFFQVQNACCFAFASVYAWLPLGLLGVERAVQSQGWRARAGWWAVGGLAVSQILAAWLGQGAYYACLLIGGYLAFRTLVSAPADQPALGGFRAGARRRVLLALPHAVGIFGWGFALGAAGLMPRMEFNALSNLAGGYSGAEASVGGLHPKDWVLLASPGFWYAGASVLALAVCAPFVLRGRWRARPLWYFGVTSVGALLISGRVETPLHWVLYQVLPGFARLHPHAPERILTVAYLGPALLAGAVAGMLWDRCWPSLIIVRSDAQRWLVSGLAVAVVAVDLTLGGAKARADFRLTDPMNGADKLTPVDLSTYYAPDAPARFLIDRQSSDGGPTRYVGYAPFIDGEGEAWPYSTRFRDPTTASLQVDNRALSVGLQDIQGYDASHLGVYDAYLAALNGRTQNYHDAEVFRAGLRSPLLDLLNVRYIIVPTTGYLDELDRVTLQRFSAPVYSDERVQILENRFALPRAWIVHAAQQVGAAEALDLLAGGTVDPRQVALLDSAPPPLAPSSTPLADRATVTQAAADDLTIATETDSPGLLVLSEVAYPAWHAYVDGNATPVLLADGTLRAVPVSHGPHTVELRFESASLTLGSVISAFAALLIVGLAGVAGAKALRSRWRRRSGRAPGRRRSGAWRLDRADGGVRSSASGH